MRWEYSSLSLLMWLGLILYGVATVGLFVLISKSRNKKYSFNLCATAIVSIHVFLLIGLGFSSSASSSKKVGFEAWVCGRQVEIRASNSTSSFTSGDDARFSSDKTLIVNGENGKVQLLPSLKAAGLKSEVPAGRFQIPISRAFELKTSSDSSLSWLNDSLKYPTASVSPVLDVSSGGVVCPYGGSDEWNVFVASVDNENNTYSWKRLQFGELSALRVTASDGGDLPDCVVFDYGPKKATPEHRCAYLLKNDSERCPSSDKSECKYREVDPT